jgi:hypothetical protein
LFHGKTLQEPGHLGGSNTEGEEVNTFRLVTISIVALVTLLCIPAVAPAQDRIKDILDNPIAYKRVTVVGTVTQQDAETGAFYILKGDYGEMIHVRTYNQLPIPGDRVQVVGIITLDQVRKVFLDEQSRTLLNAPPVVEQPPDNSFIVTVLIGAIVVVFVILLVLLIFLMKGKKQPAQADQIPAAAPSASEPTPSPAMEPAPSEELRGHTIKLFSPPPGTMKLLPGRLEVAAGDDKIKEVRFFLPKGQSDAEFTFGRASGKPYVHIQLSHATVSSRQAKLAFMDGKYRLINYSTVNNTRINDKELAENESAELNDGDKIEMGAVKFVYHSK